MFQPKARRIVPVLALTAALSLVPLADASAARARTARSEPAAPAVSLLVQLEAQLVSFWDCCSDLVGRRRTYGRQRLAQSPAAVRSGASRPGFGPVGSAGLCLRHGGSVSRI